MRPDRHVLWQPSLSLCLCGGCRQGAIVVALCAHDASLSAVRDQSQIRLVNVVVGVMRSQE
jgi:hypothetical protein